MEVVGQDLTRGLPINLSMSNQEIYEAIKIPIEKICFSIKAVIESCPPESVADIPSNGIILTGGGAQLRNLDKLLYQELGIHASVTPSPEYPTINGLGKLLDHIDSIHNRVIEYSPCIGRKDITKTVDQ